MARVLMIRLGAMGDIVHAMPAALSLSASYGRIDWAVERRWSPLLDGGSSHWNVIPMDRVGLRAIAESLRRVRDRAYDIVVDLQGLWKSAAVALAAQPARIYGFDGGHAREPMATVVYTNRVAPRSRHIAGQYCDLAEAAGGAACAPAFPLPPGEPDGSLPEGPFVLANPLAGWPAKQWPLDRYAELSQRLRDELRMELVLNVPPANVEQVNGFGRIHVSGLSGLIYATRRARAVIGLDSGPMHLAAALGVPGVALFGPTDPARNGPVGHSFTVLRDEGAATSYRRSGEIDESMRRITVDQVVEALRRSLGEGT